MKRSFLVVGIVMIIVGGMTPACLASDAVNAMCPIGKEPIVPSAGTIEYDGHTIGLCCPGCGKAFLLYEFTRADFAPNADSRRRRTV